MRKLSLLLAWLSLSVVSYTQTLVAYYPFNGNANDESGNSRNPTYNGASLTTDRFGNANRAYSFSGLAFGHIEYSANGLPATNRTISLWFYVPDVSNRPGILGYGGDGNCGTTLLMGLNCTGSGQYWVQGHCGLNPAAYTYPASPVNQWYHWVLTINGSTQKIYVNGVLKSTDNTFSGSTATGGVAELSFGVLPHTNGLAPYTDANVGYLQGKLDDIRIYDAALSDAQVMQLYSNESTGLVAYYPFNGNANDESGNSRHGTVMNGAALTTDRFNNAGSAYEFDGINDYIDISATGLPTTDRTVAFWLRPATGNQPSYPVCYGGNSCGYSFLTGFNAAMSAQYNTQGHCNTNLLATSSWTTNPENTWVHFAVTISGTAIKIFINGLEAASNNSFSIATYVDGRKLIIGGLITPDGLSTYVDGSGGYFKGKLDDIRIYDVAITGAQVLQLYQNESTGLVAYYPFNGNANDESGNNHHGTVNGATLASDRKNLPDKAYNFDGNNDYISVPVHPDWSFNGHDFSISTWINVNVISTSRMVSAGYNANDGIWGFGYGTHPVWGTGLRINFFVYSSGGFRDFSSNEITGYSTGQWAHVGIVKKGTTIYYYFNGNAAGKSTGMIYPVNANSFLRIGCRSSWSEPELIEFFNGKIDELRIYNRAISPNEMAELADVPMMPELLAYLPMNGDANDKSGNNRNGTPYGGVALTTDKYDNVSAYYFTNPECGISLANSTALDFIGQPFAISAWVKYSNIPAADFAVVAKHNCGSPNGYVLGINNNSPRFYLCSGGNWSIITASQTYNDNKWHHLVATYEGTGTQRLYVDGELVASAASVVYNSPGSGAPVIIGDANNNCGGGTFSASIDEVKIYGASLRPNQVAALYKLSRGSGKAMLFQPNSPNAIQIIDEIPTGGIPPDLTFEAWVKRGSSGPNQWLFAGNVAGNIMWGFNNNTMVYGMMGSSLATSTDISEINDGKWHHVAVTYNNSSGLTSFYVDGIAKGTTSGTLSFTGGYYSIGCKPATSESFDGYLDEVRIWGLVRSLDNIRNWMCRKLVPSPENNDLGLYFNFDESSIYRAYDVNAGFKAVVNGTQYVTSGAPIGDGSVHNVSSPTVPATLTLSTGENFSALQNAGTALGLYIYVVKDPPDIQTGILGLGGNDHYFGVTKVEMPSGTTASYTATYNYTGNPLISSWTEPTLLLFKRANNSAATWNNSGATLNTTTNTLTVSGQNTEYILGSSGFGLPVTMLSFEARKINTTTVQLNWKTATEINNKGFEVQRSFDGTYFTAISFVNGAGNSDVLKEYIITDVPGKTGRVYYRLRQVDVDGNSKLSPIASVVFDQQNMVKLYPNPAQHHVTIEGVDIYQRIQLLDVSGKLVKEQLLNGQFTIIMNLEGLRSGLYLMRLMNGKDTMTIKLMIGN